MTKSRKGLTAAEFVARLQADPNYARERASFDAVRFEQAARTKAAMGPVLRELGEAGYSIDSLSDLWESGVVYKRAIPILLKWLPLVSDVEAKEYIVRALSVPWAKVAAAPMLIAEFLRARASDTGLKWAIGNALEVVADQAVFEQLCELARDPRHDTSRQMIILTLGRLKNAKAIDLLIELLDQDGVSGHAVMALAKFQTETARPYFERFLQDSRTWVRREAAKGLAKLDKLKCARK